MFFIIQQKRTAPLGVDSIRDRGGKSFLRGFKNNYFINSQFKTLLLKLLVKVLREFGVLAVVHGAVDNAGNLLLKRIFQNRQ